jgi:hypothetical protein
MKTAIVAAALLCFAAFGASADALYPAALTFEPGYASGPYFGFPWWNAPKHGDPITIVGRVASVGAPFDGLLPAGVYELTYVFEGFSCAGTDMWDDMVCPRGGIGGTFQNGTLSIHLDTTPDADFTNAATFRDGDLVLFALSSQMHVTDDDPLGGCASSFPNAPDVVADLTFAGGTWFSRVSSHGIGLTGLSQGELDNNVSAGLQALGYIFRVDGTVDIFGPVAIQPTTWGAVKALYR